MGTGYTRADVANNIADGNIINSADLDNEYDAIEAAFNSSTGHTHDGTSAEGGPITVVGPVQDLVVSATEVKPKTTNTLDLGTSALLYKDAYLQGNMYFRDTALKIVSSADGQLDIDADVEVEITAPTLDIDASTAVTINTTTLALSGNMTFGDNDKAIFGAGSDLQIYHDGSNSYVKDAGTGDLYLQGSNNVQIESAAGANMIYATAGAQVRLFYNASPKFETTNTGVDVTGTVTADGLTVEGVGVFSTASPNIRLDETDTVDLNTRFRGQAGSLRIETTTDAADLVGTRLLIDHATGDISFYEDTGTTEKFFWDASAESLGIGSNVFSTTNRLVLAGYNTTNSDPQGAILFTDGGGNSDAAIRSYRGTAYTNGELAFETASSGSLTERMRIDSSGNTLFGTTGTAASSYGAKVLVDSSSRIFAVHRQASDGDLITFARGGTDAGGISYAAGYLDVNGEVNGVTLSSGGTEVMRVTNDGAVITNDSNATQLTLVSTDPDNVEGPRLDLQRDSASPADADAVGTIRWLANDSAAANTTYAEIQTLLKDVTAGTTDASIQLLVRRDGSLTQGLSLNPTDSVFNESGNDVDFRVESSLDPNAFFINGGTSNVGINRSPSYTLDVEPADSGNSELRVLAGTDSGADAILRLQTLATSAGESSIYFGDNGSSSIGRVVYEHTTNSMNFWTNSNARMIIQSAGNVDFLNSVRVVASEGDNPAYTSSTSAEGCELNTDHLVVVRNSSNVVYLNRTGTDGNLMSFYAQGSSEGGISVSGGTVSFVGGHLARWSQLADNTRDTSIVKGTVMTNLDQMAVWHHEAVAAQDAVLDEEGNVVTEAVEAKDAYTEDNEQLNCMAVSSVEGDPNVAGVFVNWDTDDDEFNDMNIAMTGDMVIRIAQGTTVARGDLLMSAGDGTAKPQGDDIVRSKTIAKVTSTHVSHTYDDGSYLVPCVLMAC